MTPFKKLNFGVTLQPVPTDKVLVQHSGSHDRNKFLHTDKLDEANIAGIKLYSCGTKFDSEIIEQLPQELVSIETPSVYYMEVEKENNEATYLPPHIDRGRRCALNFYIDCDEEVTEFYDENANMLGSFSATKGSAWLLDVSKPHSVKFNNSNKRTGITLSFKHKNYEQVVSALKGCVC